MAANATINLLGSDQTAAAFASVNNRLQSMGKQAASASTSISKAFNATRIGMFALAAAGASLTQIPEKLAEAIVDMQNGVSLLDAVFGNKDDRENIRSQLAALGEQALVLQGQISEATRTESQNTRALYAEREKLRKQTSEAANSPEAQLRVAQAGVALQKVELDLIKVANAEKEKRRRASEDLGIALTERIHAEAALSAVMGKEIDRGKLIANLEKQRALFLNEISSLDPKLATNQEQRAIAEKNLAEVTRALIPLMERELQLGKAIGDTIAMSFEDAIFSGQKLGEVIRALGVDIMRLVFRESITGPMASGLGSMISGMFRADGGPVNSGSPYIVGEEGPELFVPSGSGRIMNSGQVASTSGGSSGPVMNFIYNIAAGVTRSDLKPILDQQRAQLRAEIPDMVRRGGSYRSAFA